MNAVTVEEAFLDHEPRMPLTLVKPDLHIFIGLGRLYINKVFHCKVSGDIPPNGNYRIDVSMCDKLMKQTPYVIDTKYRIHWLNPDRVIPDYIYCDTCDKYVKLYNKITDSINAGIDVILTI